MLPNLNNPIVQKKSLIPWIFVIFFTVIFAVNGLFIYLAETTWSGVAVAESYRKGLKYDEVIEYVEKQKELGWSSKIMSDSAGEFENLSVQLFDKNRQPIRDAKVVLSITRPTQEGYDFTVDLVFDSKKLLYLAPVKFPMKGQWSVEVRAIKDKNIYQDVKILIIK